MQVLFLVGNDAWASSDDTKEVLQLLGCPKALSMMDIFWASHQIYPDPYAITATLHDTTMALSPVNRNFWKSARPGRCVHEGSMSSSACKRPVP